MLMNSWLKSLRNLCSVPSGRVSLHRRTTRKRKLQDRGQRPAEILENRQLLTTFTVNSLADTPDATPGDGIAVDANGETSLRAAIEEANALTGSHEVNFNDGTLAGVNFHDAIADTIVLSGSDIDLDSDVTVNGPGADLLTIDPNGSSRAFNVIGTSVVTIADLSVSNGNASGGTGAAVRVAGSATAELFQVELHDNVALTGGAGGGAIDNRGTLAIINSTLANNRAGTGGAIFNDGDLQVINSTLSGNRAGLGAFGNGGGIRTVGGQVEITNSTIVNNSSRNVGGGIHTIGGSVTVNNSIVSGNSRINGSTSNIGGSFTGANNLIGGNVNSIVASLSDNGGPTRTHNLRTGSPAIDAGDDSLAVDGAANALQNDQRGAGFFRRVNSVDIGAVESQEMPGLVVTTALDVVDPLDDLTSLREAIAFANANPDFSEVTFGDGTALLGGTDFTDANPDTITLNGSALLITTSVSVVGPGSDLLTVSGNDLSRVAGISTAGGDVSLSAFTVANGNATSGGGVTHNDNSSNVLTLNDMVFTANSVDRFGGAVYSASPLVVNRTEFFENTAQVGGAIYSFQATATISESTIYDNTATLNAGAVFGRGGTFANPLVIINSTLSGNVAETGNGGAIANSDSNRIEIVNSTLTGNSASLLGQGIHNRGNLFVDNSLVIGNGATISTADIEVSGLSPVARRSSIVGGDASLVLDSVLADNGGPTPTHALIAGSPARNSGDDALAVDRNGNPLTSDQRGENRFVGTVDIGAVEVQNQAPMADAGGPYTVAEGSTVILDGSNSSDPDGDNLTYEWDLNYDGLSFDVDATGATVGFSGIDDGTSTVALRVFDGTELSEIVTTVVETTNEAPTINSLGTDAESTASKSVDGVVTLSGVVADAGVADTHEVVVDWGDGNIETVVAAGDLLASPDFSGAEHTYATGGVFTVTVTVTDDDGASVSATTSAVVQGVGLVDGVLYVIGTSGDDVVVIKERQRGSVLRVRTKLDGGQTHVADFDFDDVERIEMHLCEGDDYASMTHHRRWQTQSVDIPATIIGGAGNDILIGGHADDVIDGGEGDDCLHGEGGDDTMHGGGGNDYIDGGRGDDLVLAGDGHDWVFGGSGNDILLGQAGNDWMFGGLGDDILIAGEGRDRLFGWFGQDILITGDTNFDSDETALKRMRDLWTEDGSVASRAQAILDEGLEVTHDDDVDLAWGGWGFDWLLSDSELDYAG